MCLCVCVRACAFVGIDDWKGLWMCVCTRLCVCVCACVCPWEHVCDMCVHLGACVCVCVHLGACVCVCVCVSKLATCLCRLVFQEDL